MTKVRLYSPPTFADGRDVNEVLQTIRRSILARGGLAEENRVLEAVIWNFYKRLPAKEKHEIAIGSSMPRSWESYEWAKFRSKLLVSEQFAKLREEARTHMSYLRDIGEIIESKTLADGKTYRMLSLRGTMISVGTY